MTTVRSIAPSRTLIPIEEVVKRTGVSRTTIWRLIRSGVFISEYRIIPTKPLFSAEELDAWIDERRVRQVTGGAHDTTAHSPSARMGLIADSIRAAGMAGGAV